jgi:hypothetical protein
MNIDESELASHPVILSLIRRIERLEAELQVEHAKLEKLEHEHERDHTLIEKLEHKPSFSPPKPARVAVGL